MNNIEEKELVKKLGKRIFSEANDLKRTITALANEINIDEGFIKNIINGECELEDSYKVIQKMGDIYPIDNSDLYLFEDDCEHAVKIMRAEDSAKSSRIFNRINKDKIKTPYYEYRDTAMSKLGPYKPEWIKELRIVDNNDPNNPDVVLNNGHFMHQTTFFVGTVNFYWEIKGEKFCQEMNTGDSNYITPYWPHSFTNRDENQEAYILATTFGGEVRRAQKELYAIGERSKNIVLDYRNSNKAIKQLIKQHLMNENMTINHLKEMAHKRSIEIDVINLLNGNNKIPTEDLRKIATLLNIELSDLLIPIYKSQEEVVINISRLGNKYLYPQEDNPCYRIETLARTSKMPLLKGFSIEVLTKRQPVNNLFTSLHTYNYNYGDSDIIIYWEYEGRDYEQILKKHDSLYIQPFINHSFSCLSGDGKLYVVRVSGSLNLQTQKEMSYMTNIDRTFNETLCWFE